MFANISRHKNATLNELQVLNIISYIAYLMWWRCHTKLPTIQEHAYASLAFPPCSKNHWKQLELWTICFSRRLPYFNFTHDACKCVWERMSVCEEKQYEIWIYRKQHKRKSKYICETDDDAGVPFMYVIFSHLCGTAGMNIDSRIREFRTFVTDQCHL